MIAPSVELLVQAYKSYRVFFARANLHNFMPQVVDSEDAHAAQKKLIYGRSIMPVRTSYFRRRLSPFILLTLLLLFVGAMTISCRAAAQTSGRRLAATPPMGWNDWAHYQCGFTAQTILDNARALVKTGLAAHGYNTVTIDDCWMQKDRDAHGNLQPDPQRFPQGMKPVAEAIHALGLKFGIYEDAGYETCGGYAGSGVPNGGGKDHFLQDARLFASWGVDYLKLDGCNLYVPAEEARCRSLSARPTRQRVRR